MRPFIAILAITVALICLAMAQTFDFVPTKLCTDNSNAPASTAYVHACAGAGGGGVTSWNGRIGVVTPQTGDYSFSNISGIATGAQLPFPSASTLGGTESGTAPANQFMTGITTLGVPTFAQPAFSNISGVASNAQIPVPTPSALGGVESITCSGGQFINVISASGVPSCASGGGGGTPGGSNGQVQYNNSGAFGGLTNTQLTADINVFTSTLSGAVPASGGSSTTLFLAQNGTFQTPAGGGNVSTSGTITTGNCAQWASATTILSTSAPCGGGGGTNLGYVNIVNFGAVGDGTCHQLSGIYASLAAAQAVYPFVSDLTQCVDWAATQQAINVAYNTAPLANGSFPVYCPVGNYILSNTLIFDAPNNTGGSYAAWAVGTTYPNGANVTYNGLPWISLGSGNVGNPPTSQALFPQQLELTNNANTAVGYPWATVSITNASPAVFTIVGGGSMASANEPIVLFTKEFANPNGGGTPVLPTGLNVNQVYYIIGSSISGNNFSVSATPGGAAINTSSAGVGPFFATPQVWQIAPVANAPGFSGRVSFIGADGLDSNSGCQFSTFYNWTSPAVIVGANNGNLIKNISLRGQVPGASFFSPGSNGYRCTAPSTVFAPAGAGPGVNMASIGWATMSSNGGSHRTRFENGGAQGFWANYFNGYGGNGSLSDTNSWDKVNISGGCINILFGDTQAFINEIYSSDVQNATTGVVAHLQQGAKVIGGNYSVNTGLGNSFAVTSVSSTAGCGFLCVTATITSPDTNWQSPMCAFSAGQSRNAGGSLNARQLNAWFMSSGCGYNTVSMVTARWGVIGMYIMDYNPITQVLTAGIPASWAGVYEGTCCGSSLTTDIAAITKIYASEASTIFYGDVQAESIHIENDGVPSTLTCFCTTFFGGDRPAEMKNIYFNAEISLGSTVCCNQSPTDPTLAKFYAQQTIPFINTTAGDTIIDHLVGGNNNGFPNYSEDRVLVAVENGSYLEARHSSGSNAQIGYFTSSRNGQGPLFDFLADQIYNLPVVNPGTLGQMSCGYWAFGGCALGGGTWDNASYFAPYSVYGINASNSPSDVGNQWRMSGWGQAPQWGVRPAPWANPCVLQSQITTLGGALPPITYNATLQNKFAVRVTGGGTGYTVGDILTLVGGTFSTAGQVKVDSTSGGVITSVEVTNIGAYSVAPATFTAAGGTGMGATFDTGSNHQGWYVHYNISYPMLWGGTIYHICDYKGGTGSAGAYAQMSTNTGYSYFQNLTTTNVPDLNWKLDGVSPFIYMNNEALELMFPGLVFSLTGSGGCSGTESFMVLETHPTLGYVKVVRVDNDGSNYLPALAPAGTSCTGTTIGQQAPNIGTNPF